MIGVNVSAYSRALFKISSDFAFLGHQTEMRSAGEVKAHVEDAGMEQIAFDCELLAYSAHEYLEDVDATLATDGIKTPYARHIVAAKSLGPIAFKDVNCCVEAEPRFLHTLRLVEQETPKPPYHMPAVIYVDPDDERPLAIQKSSGEDSIYTFEDIYANTQGGLQIVPRDSIGGVDIVKDSLAEEVLGMMFMEARTGLVVLPLDSEVVASIGFQRKSTLTLAPSIRRAMAAAGAIYYTNLQKGAYEASVTTPLKMFKRVCQILRSNIPRVDLS